MSNKKEGNVVGTDTQWILFAIKTKVISFAKKGLQLNKHSKGIKPVVFICSS